MKKTSDGIQPIKYICKKAKLIVGELQPYYPRCKEAKPIPGLKIEWTILHLNHCKEEKRMNRLTKKNSKGFYEPKLSRKPDMTETLDVNKACIQKLGELEDLEEEIGIDLPMLVKVMEQQNVWTKYKDEIDCCDRCLYTLGEIFIYFYWYNGKHLVFKLSEYGEAWALTKEELE